MKISDVFEKLNPRYIWTGMAYRRAVVNGFFYNDDEVALMDALLRSPVIGVNPHWYKRKKRHEIILQISGKDVVKFLEFYQWRDQKKEKRRQRMLRDALYEQSS